MKQFNPKDKICVNCKYFSSHVGVGQGMRCSHPSKRKDGEMAPTILGRRHTCELFERKAVK